MPYILEEIRSFTRYNAPQDKYEHEPDGSSNHECAIGIVKSR